MVGLYRTVNVRWPGHAGLYKWQRGVSRLPAPRKEIKTICLTILEVWKQAVFAITANSL